MVKYYNHDNVLESTSVRLSRTRDVPKEKHFHIFAVEQKLVEKLATGTVSWGVLNSGPEKNNSISSTERDLRFSRRCCTI